jgi:hypothetical protein
MKPIAPLFLRNQSLGIIINLIAGPEAVLTFDVGVTRLVSQAPLAPWATDFHEIRLPVAAPEPLHGSTGSLSF